VARAAAKKAAAAAGDHTAAAAVHEPESEPGDEGVVFAGDDQPVVEDVVVAAIGGLHPTDVLLDNQATIHLFYNDDLLSALRKAEKEVYVRGVGGRVQAAMMGDFGSLGEVYHCPESPVNVLSFSMVRDKYVVSYSYENDAFSVATPGGTIVFHRLNTKGISGGLYVHRVQHPPVRGGVFIETVEGNE
jgi:hypothetical protein